MRKLLFVGAVVAACTSMASAAVILEDNFDSYADTAALNAVWPIGVGTGGVLSTDQAYSAPKSVFQDGTTTAMRRDRTFAETAGTDANPLEVSFRFYDEDRGNARQYIQFLDYAPASSQLISLGLYNSGTNKYTGVAATVTELNTFYSFRIAFGTGSGWFLLNKPGVAERSVGWHELKMVIKTSTIEFFVDGTAGMDALPLASTLSFEQIRIGSGLSSANGDAYYDDVKIEVTPEPVALAMLGLGSLLFVRRRRTA